VEKVKKGEKRDGESNEQERVDLASSISNINSSGSFSRIMGGINMV
jgi:hypothetical protein